MIESGFELMREMIGGDIGRKLTIAIMLFGFGGVMGYLISAVFTNAEKMDEPELTAIQEMILKACSDNWSTSIGDVFNSGVTGNLYNAHVKFLEGHGFVMTVHERYVRITPEGEEWLERNCR